MVVPLRLLTRPRAGIARYDDHRRGRSAAATPRWPASRSRWPASPLTYLAARRGPVSTLAVYVDGMQWPEVPSSTARRRTPGFSPSSRSPDQTVTTVTLRRRDQRGAAPDAGAGNVVATYRYGAGAASPPAGRLTTILKPQPNLASLQNPVAVSGGADPQAPGDVRANAPASVLTFGRADLGRRLRDHRGARLPASPGRRLLDAGTPDRAPWRPSTSGRRPGGRRGGERRAGRRGRTRTGPLLVLAATPVELSLSGTLVVAAGWPTTAVTAAAAAAVADPATGLFAPPGWASGSGSTAARSTPR